MAGIHSTLVQRSLAKASSEASGGGWGRRHAQAWMVGRHEERAIVKMIESLASYADLHARRFESKLGNDGFLGPLWAGMVCGVRGLLNGDTGNLDCGTLDGLLLDMLAAEGFSEDGEYLSSAPTGAHSCPAANGNGECPVCK